MRSRRSSRRSAPGVTLVEAALGAALLGSLLVTILIGAARLQRQAARAERRIDALRVADRLLEGWWADPETFPHRSSGRHQDAWTWRTDVRPYEAARALGGEIIVLEVYPAGADGGDPAARVEIFLPKKETHAARSDTR